MRCVRLVNIARVFLFRIPVFWFLQNFTSLGEASVGIVMMVSIISVAVLAAVTAFVVIRQFKKEYHLEQEVPVSQGNTFFSRTLYQKES